MKLVEMFMVPLDSRTKGEHDTFKTKDRGVFSRFCAPTEDIFLVWRPWGGNLCNFQYEIEFILKEKDVFYPQ